MKNEKMIMVPAVSVGLVIGRGGETVRDIQEKTGTTAFLEIFGLPKSLNKTPQFRLF
jgi:ribosomal protein S3